eukprot:comp24209_c0_seq1/m.44476 comp24209_c0_seq1/g.44476  ORF comp24209_c0_seq1/g.44476 comp24209_c0_seq1/m.44476 type:complete len:371 (-) comp24209_c0_seq1:765-1877(-)
MASYMTDEYGYTGPPNPPSGQGYPGQQQQQQQSGYGMGSGGYSGGSGYSHGPSSPGGGYNQGMWGGQQDNSMGGGSWNQGGGGMGGGGAGMYAPAPSHTPTMSHQMPPQPMAAPPSHHMGGGAGLGGFGDPTQFMNLVNNPLLGNAMNNMAEWDKKKESVEKGVSRMKYYFNVNNSYVLNKLLLLVFPWRHKNWGRRQANTQDGHPVFLPPRDDINAPDLYIPSMAFVTFIVVAGVYYGSTQSFEPEKLGMVASSTLAWLVFEIGLIMMGFYLMGVGAEYSFLDLIAYCGYKYIGMIVSLVAFIAGGRQAYYGALVYTGICVAFLLMRTLAFVVQPEGASHYTSHNSKRNYFILVVALLQPTMAYWLTSL